MDLFRVLCIRDIPGNYTLDYSKVLPYVRRLELAQKGELSCMQWVLSEFILYYSAEPYPLELSPPWKVLRE